METDNQQPKADSPQADTQRSNPGIEKSRTEDSQQPNAIKIAWPPPIALKYLLLPALLYLAAMVVALLRHRGQVLGVLFALSSLPFVFSLIAPFISNKRPIFGCLFFLLNTLALIDVLCLTFVIRNFDEEMDGFAAFSALTSIGLEGLLALSLVVFVPVTFLRKNRSRQYIPAGLQPSNRPEALLEQRITRISGRFDNFRLSLSREKKAIDETLNLIRSELEEQLENLNILKSELEKAREEADYYRSVASLSKKDQEVFLKMVSRNRSKEYWVGFLIGLFSSAIIAVVATVLERIAKGE